MAGHSHWAGIKHKKGAADAKRGKLFSKLAKFIIVAARDGGGDPEANINLKYAIERARAENMPKDNIERAIKKGLGEIEGQSYVELVYEGFGPEKIGVVLDILTDNRNRTASELRRLFERNGGNLGNPGSVVWMFETKGLLEVPLDKVEEDTLLEVSLEAGADDIKVEGDCHQVFCTPEQFNTVKAAFQEHNIETVFAEVVRQPTSTVVVKNPKQAKKIINFISDLDDHDDVQRVSSNFDIPEEILESLGD
ncbi:MAG: YebC/PmpR family DNA-binding transcriptional regulator [Planctomycetota bacterium]